MVKIPETSELFVTIEKTEYAQRKREKWALESLFLLLKILEET